MDYKILFSNIGYAKGIDGSLAQHLRHLHRHVHCPIPVQQQVMMQIKSVMNAEQPDLCCFVEIEHHGDGKRYSQLQALVDEDYPFFDVADKYGVNSWLSHVPWHRGRCNAFLSRHQVAFERRYFSLGSKRLIYEVQGPDNTVIFFAHFSLQKAVRAEQFRELRRLIARTEREVIVLADFNIMYGFGELAPLLRDSGLHVLSREDEPTFTFYRMQRVLDLCICADTLKDRLSLKVIPQPYSDHAALLVTLARSTATAG